MTSSAPRPALLARAGLGLLAWLISTACAVATPTGLAVHTATSRSEVVTSPRVALVIVPEAAERARRSAAAHSDEQLITKRLREIGFEVWTVGPDDRPSLVRTLRDAAERIPPDGDVAVFVLGTALGGDDDVFIVPSDAPADLPQRPQLLPGEGVRLGDVLRRFMLRKPRDVVVLIDECRPLASDRCPLDGIAATSTASGASPSIIASERLASGGSGTVPLAARPSLREPLLQALSQEGETFVRTFGRLNASVAGSDLAVRASARLSSSFSFVPSRFFQGLRTECNRVSPDADAVAIRSLAMNPLVAACEAAIRTYPYSAFFQTQLAAAQEQRAFQLAIASCEDRLNSAAYRERYPAGRFVASVNTFAQDCDRRAQEQHQRDAERRQDELRRQQEAERVRLLEQERQRQEALRLQEQERQRQQAELRRQEIQQEEERRRLEEERQRQSELERQRQEALRRGIRVRATSAAGWSVGFAPALLKIEEHANDVFDAQRRIFTTAWSGSNMEEGVAAFVQSGPNEKCNDAREWTARVLERSRGTVTRREFVSNPEARTAFLIEGQGFRGNDTVSFIDYVFIPASAPGMFVHVGGRYPTVQRELYRPELISMIRSLAVRPSGQVASFCF